MPKLPRTFIWQIQQNPIIAENLGNLSKSYHIPLNDLMKMNPYEYASICAVAVVHGRAEQAAIDKMNLNSGSQKMIQVTGGPPMNDI